MRCDLHVHSAYSTDSGNYALRRARLGESYTDPERIYGVCKQRGMDLVTISDHNTLEGALRIAHLPDVFISVEVTTHFPSEDIPLHVLVWDLTEPDHRDLQEYRPSVVELVAFLRARGLAHALAHPLYRMGKPLTVAHMEQLLVLFAVWEGRNGARSRESNELACRLATSLTAEKLARLADKYGLEPTHGGRVALTGGSDDHGALDIATTWTEAPATSRDEFFAAVAAGQCGPAGEHGSTIKLAHALTALLVNAYRAGGGELPEMLAARVGRLFDTDVEDAVERHAEISSAMSDLARLLGERARAGGVGLSALPGISGRLGAVAFAAALQAPYLATAHHHADSRQSLRAIENGFFGITVAEPEPRALVFTDTFNEVNGVAGTMRQLAAASATHRFAIPGAATSSCGRSSWTAPTRCCSPSGGSRTRSASTISCRHTCASAGCFPVFGCSSSARVLHGTISSARRLRVWSSTARRATRSSHASTRPPTSSASRAPPIRSGRCCSKRLHRGFPS